MYVEIFVNLIQTCTRFLFIEFIQKQKQTHTPTNEHTKTYGQWLS